MRYDRDSLLAFSEFMISRYPQWVKIILSRTDAEFDEGLESVLEEVIASMERNVDHLARADEETISAHLVGCLNKPGLRVTQEAHSNGHVDITIEAERTPPFRRRLGEAKIYDGPKYHVAGLKQLVDRYTTGREGQGIMLEYVKQRGIKKLVTKIRLHLDTNRPCSQSGNSQDHHIRWAFTTEHEHSSGELMRVLHLSCNLYR